MSGFLVKLLAAGFCAGLSLAPAPCPAAKTRPPNIIFFLADDLGYGDLGCFGQKKIHTPNLDRLAAEGMRLTQHYAGNAVCAPSRCVLMTGKHPGHAFIRDNREMKPEGQFPIPLDAITLPKLLKTLGYATGGFGKWGLGYPGSSGEPLKQGFDHFYGYNCQAKAHNYYPTYLWDDEQKVPLENPDFSAHQRFPAGLDPNDPANYLPYVGRQYAPDLIMEKSREFVRANKDRPFFLYVPTTVPHLALQVPEDSLKEYLGKWPDPPYDGSRSYLPHYAPRAAYAAMVTRMDREFGRLMDLIKELGLEEETIVIFSSDNGPLYSRLGGTDTDFFRSADSLRGLKGSLYEGGIREPTIVRWKNHIAPGSNSARVTGFEDWLPTLLELAGAPGSIPKNIDGISFARTLLGKSQGERPFLYREFPAYGGQQSIRIGDWIGIKQNLLAEGRKPATAPNLELYDLRSDPGEGHDLASQHPRLVARMEKLMKQQHVPSKEFPLPVLDNLK